MPGADAMKAASISCVFLLSLPCLILAAPAHLEETTALAEQDYNYDASESTGCYYNYEHYEEGDRIVTNEPCLNCTCKNRMLMCYLRVCPFTRAIGQDCTVTKSPDQCCPVISCPEVPVQLITSSTTTELPASTTAVGSVDNYGCTMEDSKFYADGAKVPSNPDKPCELCYCIRNRTACVMLECTLQIEGCQPVYEEGVCCPVRYDCDQPSLLEGPAPSSSTTTGLVFTTTPSGSLDCYHGGAIYRDGESIGTEKPCEHCYCVRGDIVCAVQDCGQPLKGKHCTPNPVPEGQCCPTTFECANSTVPLENLSELESTTSLADETNDFSVLNPPEGTQIDDQPNTENSLDEEIHHNPEDFVGETDSLPIHDDTLEINNSETETTNEGSEVHLDELPAGATDSSTSAHVQDGAGQQDASTEHNSEQNISSTLGDGNVNKDQTPSTITDAVLNKPTDNDETILNVNNESTLNLDQSATTNVAESSTSASINEESSTDSLNDKLPNSDNHEEHSSNSNYQAEDVNDATTSSIDTSNIVNQQHTSSSTLEQSESITPSIEIGSLSTDHYYQTTMAASADLGDTESITTHINEEGFSSSTENDAISDAVSSATEPAVQEGSSSTLDQDNPDLNIEPSSVPGIVNDNEQDSPTSGQNGAISSSDVTTSVPFVNNVEENSYTSVQDDSVPSTEPSVTEQVVHEESPSTSGQDDVVSSTDVTATEPTLNYINEENPSTSGQDDVVSSADSIATAPTLYNVIGENPSTSGQDDAILSADATATEATLDNVIGENPSTSGQDDAISSADTTATEPTLDNVIGENSSTSGQDDVVSSADATATEPTFNNVNEENLLTASQDDAISNAEPSVTEQTITNVNEGSSSTLEEGIADSSAEPSSAPGIIDVNEETSSTSGQDEDISIAQVTVTDQSINNINGEISPTLGEDESISSSDVTATESSLSNTNEENSSSLGQNDAVSSTELSATEYIPNEENSPSSDQHNEISNAEQSSTEPTMNNANDVSSSTPVENDAISSVEPASTESTVANVNEGSSPSSEVDGAVTPADVIANEPISNSMNEEGSSTPDQDDSISNFVESATETTNNNGVEVITPTSSHDNAVSSEETTENFINNENINQYEKVPVSNIDYSESSTVAIMNLDDATSDSANQDVVTPQEHDGLISEEVVTNNPIISNEETVPVSSNDEVESPIIPADVASDDISSPSLDKESTSVNNEPQETSTSVGTSLDHNKSPSTILNEDESTSNVAQTESVTDPTINSASDDLSLGTTQVVDISSVNANNEVSTNIPVISSDGNGSPSAEATLVSNSLTGVNNEVSSENEDTTVTIADVSGSVATEINSLVNQETTSDVNVVQTEDSTGPFTGINTNNKPISQDKIVPGSTSESESFTSAPIEENIPVINQDEMSSNIDKIEVSTVAVSQNDLNSQNTDDIGSQTASVDNVSGENVTPNNDAFSIGSTELPVNVDQSTLGFTEHQNVEDTAQDVQGTVNPSLFQNPQESDDGLPVKDVMSGASINEQSNDIPSESKPSETNANDIEQTTTVEISSELIQGNDLNNKINEPEVSSTAASSSINEETHYQTQDKQDQASMNSNENFSDAISPATQEESQTHSHTDDSQTPEHDVVLDVESDPSEDLPITSEEHDDSQSEVHDNTDAVQDVNNVSPVNGDCIIDEQVHTNNSRIETRNPCHIQCLCINGAPSCESIECPPPPPTHKNCMPIHPGSDLCCPAYACDGPLTPALQSDSQVSMDYEKPGDESLATPTAVYTSSGTTEASDTFDKLSEITSVSENEVPSDGSNENFNQANVSPITIEHDTSVSIETNVSDKEQITENESTTQITSQQSSTIGEQIVPNQEDEKNSGTAVPIIAESSHSTADELNADLAFQTEVSEASTPQSDTTSSGESAENSSTTAVQEEISSNHQITNEQTGEQLGNDQSSTLVNKNTIEEPNKDEEASVPVIENIQVNGDQQTAIQSDNQEAPSPTQPADQNESTSTVEGQPITEKDAGQAIETLTSVSQKPFSVDESEQSTEKFENAVTNNEEQESDNVITTSATNQDSSPVKLDETTNSDSIEKVEHTTSSSSNSEPLPTEDQNYDNDPVTLPEQSTSNKIEESSTHANENEPANTNDQSFTNQQVESTAIPSLDQEKDTETIVSVSENESTTLSNTLSAESDQSEDVSENVNENDVPSENEPAANQNEQEILSESVATTSIESATSSDQHNIYTVDATSSPAESELISNNDITVTSQSDVITETSSTISTISLDTENPGENESLSTLNDSQVNEEQTGVSDFTTDLPVLSESISEQVLSHTQDEYAESESTTVSINGPINEPSNSSTELTNADNKVSSSIGETDTGTVPSTYENDSVQESNDATTIPPVGQDLSENPEQIVTQNDTELSTSSSIQDEPAEDGAVSNHSETLENQEQITSSSDSENTLNVQLDSENHAQQPIESITETVSINDIPTENEIDNSVSDIQSETASTISETITSEQQTVSPSKDEQNTETESSTERVTSLTGLDENQPVDPLHDSDEPTSTGSNNELIENDTTIPSIEQPGSLPQEDHANVGESLIPGDINPPVSQDTEHLNESELKPDNNEPSSLETDHSVSQVADQVIEPESSTAITSQSEPQVEGEQQNIEQEEPITGGEQSVIHDTQEGAAETSTSETSQSDLPNEQSVSTEGVEQPVSQDANQINGHEYTTPTVDSNDTANEQPSSQDIESVVETETSAPVTSQFESLEEEQSNKDHSGSTVDMQESLHQNADQSSELESATTISSQSNSNFGEESNIDQTQSLVQPIVQDVNQDTEPTTNVSGQSEPENSLASEAERVTMNSQYEPHPEGGEPNVEQPQASQSTDEQINQEALSQDAEHFNDSEPSVEHVETESTTQISLSEPPSEGDQINVSSEDAKPASQLDEGQSIVDQTQSTGEPTSQDAEYVSGSEPTIGEPSPSPSVTEQPASHDTEVVYETDSPILHTSQQEPPGEDHSNVGQLESTEFPVNQDTGSEVTTTGVSESILVDNEQPNQGDTPSTTVDDQHDPQVQEEQTPEVQSHFSEGEEPLSHNVDQVADVDETTPVPSYSEPSNEVTPIEPAPEIQNENESTTIISYSEPNQNQDISTVDATLAPSSGELEQPQNIDESDGHTISSTVQPQLSLEEEHSGSVGQNAHETGIVETSTSNNVEQSIEQHDISQPSTESLDQQVNKGSAPVDEIVHKDTLESITTSTISSESNGVSDVSDSLPDTVGEPQIVETPSPENIDAVPEGETVQSGFPAHDTQHAHGTVPITSNYSSPIDATSPHFNDIVTTSSPVIHQTLDFPISEGIDPQLSEFLSQMSTQTPWTHKPNIEDPFPLPETDYDEEEEDSFGPGTCRYGGKVYVSAQQIPRDDPCDFCFCFRSDIICLQQSCPPPIHGCRQETIQGFCCPRYECHVSMGIGLNLTTTSTTTTTTLPPHFLPHVYNGAARHMGCFLEGRAYAVGEKVQSRSGPCLDCICGDDGKMKCEPQKCTPEPLIRKMMESSSR